ncbi:MAG: cyclic-di-AMP receptor [Chloroflexota bacterium]|nr:cyclic-di-AMP receptor [Chloroflexota bacterium]
MVALTSINRLAITIVDGAQSQDLMVALGKEEFRATIVNATGGFLHDSLVTLFIGTEESCLPRLLALLAEHCPRRTRYVPLGVETAMASGYPTMIEVSAGGAAVFILPVEEFRQL